MNTYPHRMTLWAMLSWFAEFQQWLHGDFGGPLLSLLLPVDGQLAGRRETSVVEDGPLCRCSKLEVKACALTVSSSSSVPSVAGRRRREEIPLQILFTRSFKTKLVSFLGIWIVLSYSWKWWWMYLFNAWSWGWNTRLVSLQREVRCEREVLQAHLQGLLPQLGG